MSGFGVDHLPYGVFSPPGEPPRVGVRLGDRVVDLAVATGHQEYARPHLHDLLALGPRVWAERRAEAVALVTGGGELPAYDLDEVALHLPFQPRDYVDFYASEHHASNVGRIFRPDSEPLLPNWRHLPVGYHGRAGTVVVSGTGIVRPLGQRASTGSPTAAPEPVFGPTGRLDLEAELGFVVGVGTALGERVEVDAFPDHVFGVVGLNDWSARDVQAWEYVPLGPFLGKSFATSVSAWVTPLAALDAAWTDLPGQHPTPLPYLAPEGSAWATRGLDLAVEVEINGHVVSRPPYSTMYWSPAQMLAHLTVNGASVAPGDLYASGTISGPDADQRGSLLELTWGWREPLRVGEEERTALEDGDEVVLRYSAPAVGGGRLTLGEVRGRIFPARHGAATVG